MPIFQADLSCSSDTVHHPSQPEPGPETTPEAITIPHAASKSRRLSEESLRTELCEGPVLESPRESPFHTPADDSTATANRAELIERLKRGQSPTWIPNRHVRHFLPTDTSITAFVNQKRDQVIFQQDRPVSPPTRPPRTPSRSSNLLPAAKITPEKDENSTAADVNLRNGLSIERPGSALHSGDFTHDTSPETKREDRVQKARVQSEIPPQNDWLAASPPRDYTPFQFDERRTFLQRDTPLSATFATSPVVLSPSFSSSFAYQPPTSPLVQSESNDELDLSDPLGGIDFASGRYASRRHTLYSNFSSPYASPSPRGPSSFAGRMAFHRREGSLPYQAHQPRRSLTSSSSFKHSATSPPTPAMLRRMFFGSDSSPIQQHASMVGSYEESILRGRMSTTPSKPLDFLAQIGVLGMGKCKPSLKCPAHVTLPFPAVYYSYSTTPHGRSSSEDGPSPYVGQIDLENGLPNVSDESRSRRKAHSRIADRKSVEGAGDSVTAGQAMDVETRQVPRPKRRSASPRAPPGGSYRIPEKGQIQIVIKNQNKTAVKLFLVPYDLEGMEPGTKTFIRQRSYSGGPIIDGVPNHGGAGSVERPTLRYLVHLHICCPAKGRFYLYKSIRLVFANRVPDGKEKLRNETTWPEPRFSPYKPIRVMHPPLSTSSGPGAMLAAEKAFRRRSSGFTMGAPPLSLDMADGMFTRSSMGASSGLGISNVLPLEPIPLRLPGGGRDRPGSEVSESAAAEFRSPQSSQASRPSTKDSSGADSWGVASSPYTKLSKGDIGYGGNFFSPPGPRPAGGGSESLLSQRLRSLGVKPGEAELLFDHDV
ncbi:unnamed protein product [Clonostachys solani]|uniref:Atos-like conserved domain-containing protein n=1 Tax=Clonostachys solani TaxID=160281 RepID=A0A9N9Z445_9HYPO|nr:unnamed protein product [Clonostachys solani]